jgi:hypothetical protein
LRRVKELWDRDNFFKWSQGVRISDELEEVDDEEEEEDEEHQIDRLAA